MQSYATRLRQFASGPGLLNTQREAHRLDINGDTADMARRHRSQPVSFSGPESRQAAPSEEHNLQMDEDIATVVDREQSSSSVNGPPLYNEPRGMHRQGGYHYHPRLLTVDNDRDEKPRRSFCRSWCEMWFLISKSRATCIGLSLFLFGGGLLLILLTALGGLLNCSHLMGASVFCFLMATLSIFLGFLCCCYHWVKHDEDLPFAIFCAAYGLLVLFICVTIAGTIIIFTRVDLIFNGDPPVIGAADGTEITSNCAMTGLPVATLVVSYICSVIFLLMSYWACILALGATSDIEI